MKKISIIGAGNVGGEAAFFCALKQLGEIFLIDVKEGLAEGKALDQNQALYLMGIDALIKGSDKIENISESDVVLITCGVARKKGMTREDLLKINLSIIRDVSFSIKEYAPNAFVIVMTNPVDILTYACKKYTGFSSKKVIGQAGILDSARFAYYASEHLNISQTDIKALVLGGHGDTMVPVFKTLSFGGIGVDKYMDEETMALVSEKTRKGGAEIVSLLKTSSAYYAPAYSAVLMIDAILNDRKKIYPCSVYPNGEYGFENVYIGLPALLSKEGVEKILEFDLDEKTKAQLEKSYDFYKEQISSIYW